jgi:hypothetical protein
MDILSHSTGGQHDADHQHRCENFHPYNSTLPFFGDIEELSPAS